MSKQTTYDLFISYAGDDAEWVEGSLMPALGLPAERLITKESFRYGADAVAEFERAVSNSRYTLLILSPAFLADMWGMYSESIASYARVKDERERLLPLLLKPCQIPSRIETLKLSFNCIDPTRQNEEFARLRELLNQPEPILQPLPCPYPGMRPFTEADSQYFFGRDPDVKELIEHLRSYPFVTVIGPSGSGKSSLVFAGLIPALRREELFEARGWLVYGIRPGETPLTELKKVLGSDLADSNTAVEQVLAQQPEAQRLLLVVDQFEEIFALSGQETISFQETLQHLADVPNCCVVLTVRADFYPDVMTSPLWNQIRHHRKDVVPLDKEGLRDAILKPAEQVGVFVETALVERLVADAADEPGVLPLVQETLALLWGGLKRRFLPLTAYEDLSRSGDVQLTGLQVAIARHADTVLAELRGEQQTIARRIFLRLIQFGEGRPDTRRQQTVRVLRSANENQKEFDHALEHLTTHRLLTRSGTEEDKKSKVDIAHDALIDGWPTLQNWIKERRKAEQTRRQLEAKAADWVRLDREAGLLDEVEVREAEEWLDSSDAVVLGYSSNLPELVKVSRKAIENELEKARATARRLQKRLIFATVFAIAAILAAFGTYYGFRQATQNERIATRQKELAQQERDRANQERDNARQAETEERIAKQQAIEEKKEAEKQARISKSRQLTTEARAVFEEYPQRSLLLAIEALNTTMREGELRIPATEEALREILAKPRIYGVSLSNHTSVFAISQDGHWLTTRSHDGLVQLWDLTSANPTTTGIILEGHKGDVRMVVISPDSHWLLTGNDDGPARLWNLTAKDPTATAIILQGHEGYGTVTISQDSHWLVIRDENTVRVWDLTVEDLTVPVIVLRGHKDYGTVTISSDSHWLVISDHNSTVRVWNLTAADPTATAIVLHEHGEYVQTVAISPDNHWLITTSHPNNNRFVGTIRLWDLTVADPFTAPLVSPEQRYGMVRISSNSRWLAITVDEDLNTVWVLDLMAKNPLSEIVVIGGYGDWIDTMVFSPDSRWLLTRNDSNAAKLWDLMAEDPTASAHFLQGYIMKVVFSPDSHWLVTGSIDGTARLKDLTAADPSTPAIALHGHKNVIWAVSISPDSHWLATGSSDGTARLWDLTAADPTATPFVLRGHDGEVRTVAISSDNQWLITRSTDSTDSMVRLWDLTTANSSVTPVVLGGHQEGIYTMTISPDNRWLVTSGNRRVRLWLLNLAATDPTVTAIGSRRDEGYFSMVDISPDSRWLLTNSLDRTLQLWDLTAADPTTTAIVLRGHKGDLRMVTISPDSRWLVTGSEDDGPVRLWDLTVADPTATASILQGHKGDGTVAISADSHWLVIRDRDTVRVWDLTAVDPTAPAIVLRGYDKYNGTVAISPDGRWLVTDSDDGTARLWDLAVADPAATALVLRGHEGDVRMIAISPDSGWLVTGSDDGTARLWDLKVADPVATAFVLRGYDLRGYDEYNGTVTISPDSRWLVTGSNDGTARLWDLTAENPATTAAILRGHENRIETMAISLDSRWLVTGNRDTIRVWDLAASDPAITAIVLRGHEGNIRTVTISPDNRWLVSGSSDGTARLWMLQFDELIELACCTAGRNLSYVEWNLYFWGEAYQLTCPDLPIHNSVLEQGRKFVKSGDIDSALAIFRQNGEFDSRLRIDPQMVDKKKVWNYLENAFSIQNKLDDAFAGCEKQVKVKPDYNWVWYNIGDARYEQGQFDEVIAAFRKQVEVKPDHENAWNYLGNTFYKQDKFDDALAAFQQQVEVKPDHEWAWYNIGKVRYKQGKFDEAVIAYRKQIEVKPNHESAWYKMGRAFEKLDKSDEAIAAYRKQVEVTPDHEWAWSDIGDIRYEQGKFDEAIAAYRKQVEVTPDHEWAWSDIGNVRYEQGKFDEAIAAYRKQVEVTPDHEWAWSDIGDIRYEQGKFDEAIAAYRKQVEVNPRHKVAWASMGLVLERQGNPDEAITAYKEHVKIMPDSGVWYLIGRISDKQDKLDEAIAAFRKQVEVKPDHENAWYYLGKAFYKQDKLEEAIAAFRKQLEVKPDHEWAWYRIGRILQGQEKFDEAIVAFQEHVEIKPAHANAWNYLGIALWKQDKMDKTAFAFAKALALEPDNPIFLHNDAKLALVQGDIQRCQVRINTAIPLVKSDNPLSVILSFYKWLAKPEQGWENVMTAIVQLEQGVDVQFNSSNFTPVVERQDEETQYTMQQFITFFEGAIDLPTLKKRLTEYSR